ncbi:MAG: carboxypeptidase-like regulatory domain-containing protein [Chloroflexota bacterium]|nr:carboxypeptidase-like regulatory domain-containing protein [Chloroflexota bacterium]
MNDVSDNVKRFLVWISGAPADANDPGEETARITQIDSSRPPVQETPDDELPLQPTDSPPAEPRAQPENSSEPINDAVRYGVTVERADVTPGTEYWQAVRVHHLTPAENHGNHHIYLDALDEGGARVYGAQAEVSWVGGVKTVVIDKPLNEAGTNFPMWKWQICDVSMVDLPGDRVFHLHTAHPDEPPGLGNTLFHHSFHIDFRRTIKGEPLVSLSSVIEGQVKNGAGYTLLLTLDGQVVASTVLGSEARFRFADLGEGSYVLAVSGTGIYSNPIDVDGTDVATVDLEVPEDLAGKVIERYYLFGSMASPRTPVYLAIARNSLIQNRACFGFLPEEAQRAQEVVLIGDERDIALTVEEGLLAAGCQVHRIEGSAEEILAALADLGQG